MSYTFDTWLFGTAYYLIMHSKSRLPTLCIMRLSTVLGILCRMESRPTFCIRDDSIEDFQWDAPSGWITRFYISLIVPLLLSLSFHISSLPSAQSAMSETPRKHTAGLSLRHKDFVCMVWSVRRWEWENTNAKHVSLCLSLLWCFF